MVWVRSSGGRAVHPRARRDARMGAKFVGRAGARAWGAALFARVGIQRSGYHGRLHGKHGQGIRGVARGFSSRFQLPREALDPTSFSKGNVVMSVSIP